MRPPSVPRSAAANPQRWKSAAAASSTPTTNPKVVTACRTIRARGKFWTSMVRLLVRQPGYLREARGFASPPRDGFAIVDRPRRVDGDRRQQATALPARPARGLLGWVRTVPRFGGAASARGAAAAN